MNEDMSEIYKKDNEVPNALRLEVPSKSDYKWINHLSHFELVDYEFLGFWVSRGYSNDADLSSNELSINETLLPSNVPLYPPLVTTPAVEPSPSRSHSYTNSPVLFQPMSTSPSKTPSISEAGYAIVVVIA